MSFKIRISVKPQAKKENVTKVADGEYRVSVHPPAQDNQANQAVVKLLAEHFSVPKSAVTILRGNASKKKLIEIG
ncbi:MAG TPA: DUF167 domain-containing protein [Candidatus Binatia bacterium]|nr:DUF167 domain-containing protein [Candidatus Binatia bacterium]